ncbi:cobaltochelatase subunit CobN [Chitinophaga sp. Cy-1792]|uniref:cobaltochelatase subunit CobN n=1 Tax=Chitinophaga sp. Cy-1792 TaxID=2608339 RepID=UPI001422B9F3|nr:cobaltochelatase subunit CobN [Chitinophaga sp. Cy-1792]NIG56477.1 cobaltochelatase subunit CobN [Chitinophaga sp. Cy-1792]
MKEIINKRGRWIAGLVLFFILLATAVWYYRKNIAPVKIALVNYPSFAMARIQQANDSRWVDLRALPEEDITAKATRYDVIFLFGRGLHLSKSQQEALQVAGNKGVKIYTEAAADPHTDATTIKGKQLEQVTAYMRFGGTANFSNLLHFARTELVARSWFKLPVSPPVPIPADVFFHIDETQNFPALPPFEAYLRKKGFYKEGAPRIALLTSVPGPFNANRDHLDTIISVFQRKGWNVYPIAGMKKRLEFLQAVHPDMVVEMPHGRISTGNSAAVSAWLKQRNIPLLSPVTVFAPFDRWMNDPQGLSGGMLTQSIVAPELDGGVAPYAFVAQYRDAAGYDIFRAIPDRLEKFTGLMEKWLSLKHKANKDKRIAIYYFKGPGMASLVAGNLEVVPSLYNLLVHLKAQGYTVNDLPADASALNQLLQQNGAVLNPYATGSLDAFYKNGHPALIPVSTYKQWAAQDLSPVAWQAVVARYGEAPGDYMSLRQKDTSFLAVARLTFGNIVLLPQPLPGIGDNTFKLVHGAKVAPPHSYIASYLWMKHGFNPDAVIHFGTHGSLEFTPGKQVALSSNDWSDALIGNTPHYYVYTMSNVGEAIIAKRRSYATIISHLTPPFMKAGGTDDMRQLEEILQKYSAMEAGPLKQEYQRTAEEKARQLGLLQALHLKNLDSTAIEKLEALVEETTNENVNAGLYTIGKAYTPQQAKRTAALMSGADSNATAYTEKLLASTEAELAAIDNALSGGYTSPSAGGDPLGSPGAIPTGRNLFSIDAEKTPGPQAWNVGVQLAKDLIQQYREQHSYAWPRKVAFTLWPGEFIRTEGAMLAEIFYLLGVAPVRDPQGRITDLELIPAAQLQRPRIDVVVQTAGQFRDLAASRLQLIDKALKLAARAGDNEQFANYVATGNTAAEELLRKKGFSPKEARELAAMRVFGGIDGNYGTNIMNMVEQSDRYNDNNEVAKVYLNNMGAVYTDTAHWAMFREGVFEAALQQTDVVVQPRESSSWGALSLDHVYEFMGGLSNVVRYTTGKDPYAVLNDYRNPQQATVRELKAAVWTEAQSTVLNPQWIKEMQAGHSSSAEKITETFRNVFGWNIMKPDLIDQQLWNQLHEVYINDRYTLKLHQFFERENAPALEELTGVMMEASRKGLWHASEKQLNEIATLHATLVRDHGAGCTQFVCGNTALQREMMQHLAPGIAADYTTGINKALKAGNAEGSKAKSVVLKQEVAAIPDQPSDSWFWYGAIGAAILLAIVIINMLRKSK